MVIWFGNFSLDSGVVHFRLFAILVAAIHEHLLACFVYYIVFFFPLLLLKLKRLQEMQNVGKFILVFLAFFFREMVGYAWHECCYSFICVAKVLGCYDL
uniref:Uncharacterized protein n=1 Tax=Rhizophora mucronata TaxID=61149 RepID=A0A2P2PET5_RHIMU